MEVQRQLAEFEADTSTLQAQLQAQGGDLQKAQGEAALLRKQLDWANNQLADAEDKARSATAAAQRTALVVCALSALCHSNSSDHLPVCMGDWERGASAQQPVLVSSAQRSSVCKTWPD